MRSLLLLASVVFAACTADPHDHDHDHGDAGHEDAGWINPDGGIPTGNCQGDHLIIAQETARLIEQYSGACTTDSDCTQLNRDVPCSSFCPEPVLAATASQVRAEIAAYGDEVCPLVPCNAAGNCPAFETVLCHQGLCRRGFLDGGVSP